MLLMDEFSRRMIRNPPIQIPLLRNLKPCPHSLYGPLGERALGFRSECRASRYICEVMPQAARKSNTFVNVLRDK